VRQHATEKNKGGDLPKSALSVLFAALETGGF
jgi:hypothetical protein